MTLAVVAWGYLVYAAIDFGASARDGNPDAWWFLAVAALGAMACLFVGLMLIARLLRRLGSPATPVRRCRASLPAERSPEASDGFRRPRPGLRWAPRRALTPAAPAAGRPSALDEPS